MTLAQRMSQRSLVIFAPAAGGSRAGSRSASSVVDHGPGQGIDADRLALSVGEVDERLHFTCRQLQLLNRPGVRRGISCGRASAALGETPGIEPLAAPAVRSAARPR
jgi:hypothetical protein